jgi:ferrous iron transport protein B
MPTLSNLLRSTWERGWSFIKKAGTVILISTVVLWFLQGYGFEDGAFGAVSLAENSLLAYIGLPIAFLLVPLGIGFWQAAVATITGLIAKENIVATFGILYGIAEVAENGNEIWGLMTADFTPLMAFTLLVFNLLCAPCFAAIGAIKREMNDTKWTLFALGYQTAFAYAVSLVIYQIGAIFSTNVKDQTFVGPLGPILACLIIAAILFMIIRPEKKRLK